MKTTSCFPSIVTCLTALTLVHVNGYPDGAPETACDSMRPQHYTTKNNPSSGLINVKDGKSLYELQVNPTHFKPGGQVSVTMHAVGSESGNYFKGFILQARREGNGTTRFGQFLSKDNMKLICGNSAITHAGVPGGTRSFFSLTAFWVAPQYPVDNIKFHATFVKDYDKIYVDVTSDLVSSGVHLVPPMMLSVAVATLRVVVCLFV